MNKRTFKFAAICLLVLLAFTPVSFAGDPLTKLGDGFMHIFKSPAEIVNVTKEIYKDSDNDPVKAGVFGPIAGLTKMGLHIVGGVYDIGTFLLPLPAEYESIMEQT